MFWLALLLMLLASPVLAQGTSVNPPTGSIWTFKGPSVGAQWAQGVVTPLVWGAVGDGTTDDTAAVQAAWNAATAAGVPLYLGNHLYKISAISYTVGAPAPILGKMVSYTGGQEPSLACTSGFVAAATNLTMITVGHDAVLQDFCIKAGNAGVNTSGVAINMESVCDSSAACQQSYNNLVNRVVIDRAFLGIALSGQFHNITNNLIENIQPGGGGIRIGEKTNSNRSIQPNLYNNNVFGEFGGSAQYALLIKDAGGPYVTNNELNSTTYNYWINPGLDTSGGNGGQNVQAIHSTGNYADNAITNNFRVDCQAGSFGLTNGGSSFVGDWFTGVPTGPGDSVWIGTTGYAASGCKVLGLTMTQVQIYGAKGHGINVSGPGVWSLSVNNSHICGNGTESGKSGIYLASDTASTENGFTFVGNTIGGSCDGRGVVQPVGITLNSNRVTIVGNDLSQGTTTKISGTPGLNSVVANNLGIDDQAPTVASATTVNLPVNPTILLSGTTAISTFTVGYCCPTKTLIATNPAGIALIAGGNISTPITMAQYQPYTAHNVGGSWFIK